MVRLAREVNREASQQSRLEIREGGVPEEHLELFKGRGGGQLLVPRKE
jgi:hypothetical protein